VEIRRGGGGIGIGRRRGVGVRGIETAETGGEAMVIKLLLGATRLSPCSSMRFLNAFPSKMVAYIYVRYLYSASSLLPARAL
jgi:hypothetical protein